MLLGSKMAAGTLIMATVLAVLLGSRRTSKLICRLVGLPTLTADPIHADGDVIM